MPPKSLQCFVLLLLSICGVSTALCQSDWKEDAGHCYRVSYRRATWDEADKACRDMDAQLTSILNKREERFIFSIRDEYYADYWIGLKKRMVRYRWLSMLAWKWSDGSSDTYRKSKKMEGEGNCVSITGQARWQRLNCNSTTISYSSYTLHPLYYICKKNATNAGNTVRSTTTLTAIRLLQTTERLKTSFSSTPDLVTSNHPEIGMNTEGSSVKNTVTTMIAIVAVQTALIIGVVIALIVVCRKRMAKSSAIPDVPRVTPSAPPLSIYENPVADVRAGGAHEEVEAKKEEQYEMINTISGKSPRNEERGANVYLSLSKDQHRA